MPASTSPFIELGANDAAANRELDSWSFRGSMAGHAVTLVFAAACTTPRLAMPPAPQASATAPPVASAVARPEASSRMTLAFADEVDQPVGNPTDPQVDIAGSTIAFICHESVRTWPLDGHGDGATIGFASKPWSNETYSAPTAVLSPDGAVVATQHEGQPNVVLWSARSGARLVSLTRPAEKRKLEDACWTSYRGLTALIVFSDDSELVAAAWDGEPGVVRVWKVKTGSAVFTWRTSAPIQDLEFLAQGEMLMVRSGIRPAAHNVMPAEDDSVTILRLRDGRTQWRIYPFYSLSYAIPSKDGKRLLVIPTILGATEAKAEVRDIPSGRVVCRVELPVENLDYAVHGHRVALATTGIEAQVLDLDRGTLGPALPRPPATDSAWYRVVAWTPDGSRLLTAPTGTAIRVWDPLTMTLERSIPTPRGPKTIDPLVGGRFVHGWAPWTAYPGPNRLLRLSDAVAVNLLVGAPPAAEGRTRGCGGLVVADDGQYDGDETMIPHLRFRAEQGDVPPRPLSSAELNHLHRSGLFADFVAGKSMAAR